MPKKYYKLRCHLTKQWPEVLNDVCVSSMPLAYVNSIKLGFTDGRLWEIDLDSQNVDTVADQICDLIDELEKEIVKVDFDLDIDKLKQDIQDSTNKAI